MFNHLLRGFARSRAEAAETTRDDAPDVWAPWRTLDSFRRRREAGRTPVDAAGPEAGASRDDAD